MNTSDEINSFDKMDFFEEFKKNYLILLKNTQNWPTIIPKIDLTEMMNWLRHSNLHLCDVLKTDWFKIIKSIDWWKVDNTEVSFVSIDNSWDYPQHVHKESNAYILVISWKAEFLSGNKIEVIKNWDTICIPKMMPHWFRVLTQEFNFVSIQNPPIYNPVSDTHDLFNVNLNDLI